MTLGFVRKAFHAFARYRPRAFDADGLAPLAAFRKLVRKRHLNQLVLGTTQFYRTGCTLSFVVLSAVAFGGCESPAADEDDPMLLAASAKDARSPFHGYIEDSCKGGWTEGFIKSSNASMSGGEYLALMRTEPQHSPGDILRLDMSEGTEFAGSYKVNLDGHVNIPYAGRIRAAGLTSTALRQAIERTFIDKGLFHAHNIDLSIVPIEWAPIQITISGAVFQPGRGLINNAQDNKPLQTIQVVGDSPPGRFLDAGIRIGAGIRPDADLSQILLYRNGRSYRIDLSGVIDGAPVPDIYLMHGDHIEVRSTGCRQAGLVRPSQVTPPGVRIFMSNLSVPVSNNAEQHAADVPYGTRLLEAAVSANCVGGTYLTNASRRIAYITNDPITGKSTAKEYRVHDMLAHPNDLIENPYVMPNDAVACYDSEMTNIRDATRMLNEILTTVGLAIALF